jgi:hypothetical protein
VKPKTSEWSISLARVTGSGHRLRGIPCQDDAVYRSERNGSFVAAVSDGAGSGRLTHFASAVAVRSVTFTLSKRLRERCPMGADALRASLEIARDDIAALQRRFADAGVGFTSSDFACTCLVVVIADGRLAMAQVGDGAVVASSRGRLECLSPQISREYVNESTFLNSRDAFSELHLAEMSATDISGIALMTDGVQHLAVRHLDNEPHPAFFDPLFEFAAAHSEAAATERNREIADFLDSEKVNAETDDDKTLLLAVRSRAAPAEVSA